MEGVVAFPLSVLFAEPCFQAGIHRESQWHGGVAAAAVHLLPVVRARDFGDPPVSPCQQCGCAAGSCACGWSEEGARPLLDSRSEPVLPLALSLLALRW